LPYFFVELLMVSRGSQKYKCLSWDS